MKQSALRSNLERTLCHDVARALGAQPSEVSATAVKAVYRTMENAGLTCNLSSVDVINLLHLACQYLDASVDSYEIGFRHHAKTFDYISFIEKLEETFAEELAFHDSDVTDDVLAVLRELIHLAELSECLSEPISSGSFGQSARSLHISYGIQGSPSVWVYRFIACYGLWCSLLKKNADTRRSDAADIAITKFVMCNQSCSGWTPDKGIASLGSTEQYLRIVGEVRKYLEKVLTPNGKDPLEMVFVSDGNFGPGASGGSPSETLASKLSNATHTSTSPFMDAVYTAAIARSSLSCILVEFDRYARKGNERVRGSQLTTVPKNNGTDRVIAIEPLRNMFAQKAVQAYLERRLRTIGIDLSTQPDVQRLFARVGSMSGSYATIDLSSASDSISINLARELLPSSVFDLLMEIRSPETLYRDSSGKEGWLKLDMISSMGNATTFPLQTLLFRAIAHSVYKILGITDNSRGYIVDSNPGQKPKVTVVNGRKSRHINVGVFGDDIVVVREAASLMLEALFAFGFTPNASKTFVEGPFRESCGSDFYYGLNVRGVYLKSLVGRHSLFSAYNRLMYWCAEKRIPLHNTLTLLNHSVEKKLYVPHYEDDSAGFKTDSMKLLRKNAKAHCYRALVPVIAYEKVRRDPNLLLVLAVAGKLIQRNGEFLTPCRSPHHRTRFVERNIPFVSPKGSLAERPNDEIATVLSRWFTLDDGSFLSKADIKPVSRPVLADNAERYSVLH